MASENILVTGKHGSDHITSAQLGAIQAGIMGQDSYINYGLEATVTNANTVTIGTGVATVNGRSFVVEAPTPLTITSGMTGRNRNDLIGIQYTKDNAGSVPESGELKVITGTPTTGTAFDPTYPKGNILNGDSSVFFPLFRVQVRDISTPTVVSMASTLPNIQNLNATVNSLRDSVSRGVNRVTVNFSYSWHDRYYSNARVDFPKPIAGSYSLCVSPHSSGTILESTIQAKDSNGFNVLIAAPYKATEWVNINWIAVTL